MTQDGIQESPEPAMPPIEKYGRWGLMRCSAETGMLTRIDVVRMIDELISAEAEKTKLSTRVDELLAEAMKATEELARVREGYEDSLGQLWNANNAMTAALARERELNRWRDVKIQPPLISGQECWIFHPDGVKHFVEDHKTVRAHWTGDTFFGELYGWGNMRATHYMPIQRPEPPALLEPKPLAPEPVDTRDSANGKD